MFHELAEHPSAVAVCALLLAAAAVWWLSNHYVEDVLDKDGREREYPPKRGQGCTGAGGFHPCRKCGAWDYANRRCSITPNEPWDE